MSDEQVWTLALRSSIGFTLIGVLMLGVFVGMGAWLAVVIMGLSLTGQCGLLAFQWLKREQARGR